MNLANSANEKVECPETIWKMNTTVALLNSDETEFMNTTHWTELIEYSLSTINPLSERSPNSDGFQNRKNCYNANRCTHRPNRSLAICARMRLRAAISVYNVHCTLSVFKLIKWSYEHGNMDLVIWNWSYEYDEQMKFIIWTNMNMIIRS